jgi:uncharacterized protein (TIGR00369 family)
MKKTLKLLSETGYKDCFGCGSKNPHGLQMKFLADNQAVYSHVVVPSHLTGWNDMVHGGILSTILDEIMAWSAIYLLKQVAVTKSMTVEFLRPVLAGEELKVIGRVLNQPNEREAIMEGLVHKATGELCTRSEAIFSVFSPSVAIRKGIMSDADIKAFLEPLWNS